jgi:SAM-dependent methyltransferase
MSLNSDKLSTFLVCPRCHNGIVKTSSSITCFDCGLDFRPNENGFCDFTIGLATESIDCGKDDYMKIQEAEAPRVCKEWLEPFLVSETVKRVLNVGCGLGSEIPILQEKGYEAYGIDLPYISKYWKQMGYDSRYFFCSDASYLPFPAEFFDVVYSFGVIEHIGTEIGQCTLQSNYREIRQKFADELLRVTKKSGRIFIHCPNKSFPVDIAHGPSDSAGPKRHLRWFIQKHTRLTIHKTWGDYHLLSYPEVRRLFCNDREEEGCIEPLSSRNYFSFVKLDSGFARVYKILAPIYVNHLPRCFWSSFLNPFVSVMIRK